MNIVYLGYMVNTQECTLDVSIQVCEESRYRLKQIAAREKITMKDLVKILILEHEIKNGNQRELE